MFCGMVMAGSNRLTSTSSLYLVLTLSDARCLSQKPTTCHTQIHEALYFLVRYQLNVYTEHGKFMIVPWIKSEHEAEHDESAFGK